MVEFYKILKHMGEEIAILGEVVKQMKSEYIIIMKNHGYNELQIEQRFKNYLNTQKTNEIQHKF